MLSLCGCRLLLDELLDKETECVLAGHSESEESISGLSNEPGLKVFQEDVAKDSSHELVEI